MDKLIIKNLNKSYKNSVALNNISLEIKGTFGLLGPNGAGKTTLMRILATSLERDSGTITFNNIDFKDSFKVREIISYLPQHFSFYPNSKVFDVLDHLAILKGLDKKTIRHNKINELLTYLNLEEARDKKIKALSGGMLRRVGILQALLGDPKIIIIDEPTAGLDIEERVRFRNLLKKIALNRIVIISTHILEDVISTCDNICILKLGNIIFEGTVEKLNRNSNLTPEEAYLKLLGYNHEES